MPKLKVGWCQKVGEPNFSSRGASVTVEMDVDGLPSDPLKMRAQIVALFRVARHAVAEELAAAVMTNTIALPKRDNVLPSQQSGTSRSAGNGHIRLATVNQVKAIMALAMRAGMDLRGLIAERFKIRQLEDLPFQDASALIDELKKAVNALA
jgi:hypothetical protein